MNDFSEIENELKKLRPVQPSAELFVRIEKALAPSENAKIIRSDHFRVNWVATGLAAAAIFLLIARVSMDRATNRSENVAQPSHAAGKRAVLSGPAGSASANQFIPAGTTEIVYNTLDEGLRFMDSSETPMRRLRYQTHETFRWRNPHTGETLRVSYPSEEVVLIPVSGQ